MKSGAVILGPSNELHPGMHASLEANPPPGRRYRRSGATHYFLLPKGTRLDAPLSPHRYPHIGELLRFDGEADLVHSVRFPVVGRERWVMDLDNFGYPFLLGRALWNPALRARAESDPEVAGWIRQRMANAVAACLHPSCRAVLFWTADEVERAAPQLEAFGLGDQAAAFLAKVRVVAPAQAAVPSGRVAEKWKRLGSGPDPFTIVFCGRDFAVKNGELALRVYQQLRRRSDGLRLVYVGELPARREDALTPLLEGVEVHRSPARGQVLEIFEAAHVLFHPSRSESFGMVYVEAFAAGMAAVGAHGEGLRCAAEILDADGALTVDYDRIDADRREAAFVELLGELVQDPARAEAMGKRNYARVASSRGQFSLDERSRRLEEAYAGGDAAAPALRFEDLPHWDAAVPFAMESDDVRDDLAEYRHEIGFEGSNLVA